MYSAMSSIPSGGPPGGTHTQELWYSLRGIDVGLQSVLSADKCPCGACCVRVSRYYFAPEYSTKATPNFSAKLKIFRRKDPCRFFFFCDEENKRRERLCKKRVFSRFEFLRTIYEVCACIRAVFSTSLARAVPSQRARVDGTGE